MPKTIRVSDDTHEALTKLSTTRDTMDDVIQRLIRDAGKGKLLPSELEKFKKELRGNESDETKIGNILSTLRIVYYGQFNNSSGIIDEDIKNFNMENTCLQLSQYNLVRRSRYYKFDTWLPTSRGQEIAHEIVESLISKTEKQLEDKLDQFHSKIVALLAMSFEQRLSYELQGGIESRYFFNLPMGTIIKEEEEIIQELDRIVEILGNLDYGTKVTGYVSTRGGETRGRFFVVSPEVVEALKAYLIKKMPGISELNQILPKELRDIKVYHILEQWLLLHARHEEYSVDKLKKLLENEGLTWDDLKAELKPFEERRMVTCKSLENEHPLIINDPRILREIQDSIINSLGRE